MTVEFKEWLHILLLPWEVVINFQSDLLRFNLLLATKFLRAKFSHIPGTASVSPSPLKWDAWSQKPDGPSRLTSHLQAGERRSLHHLREWRCCARSWESSQRRFVVSLHYFLPPFYGGENLDFSISLGMITDWILFSI